MEFVEFFVRIITFLALVLVAYRIRNVAEVLEKILEKKEKK
jgi:hypothetical protein